MTYDQIQEHLKPEEFFKDKPTPKQALKEMNQQKEKVRMQAQGLHRMMVIK